MMEPMVAGLLNVLDFSVLLIIILGVLIGLVVGILPGIGGTTTIVLLLPFCYKLNPVAALSLVISIYAACYSSGFVTSILFGIPGEASATATIIDGLPMSQRGEGKRAMAAGAFSSLLGGIFGAGLLGGLIYVVKPIIMLFRSPELFALALLGISFIALLSTGEVLKGMFMGLLGVFIALTGVTSFSGTPRFTFGFMFLYDGFPLTSVAIGIFAIPQIIDMVVTGGIVKINGVATDVKEEVGGVRKGIMDCFRHWKTVLVGSAIGAGGGIIPGVGVNAAIWLSYGAARAISKTPHEFGKGCVEGVIGPEAADNAKEGGNLLTTCAFGVPGTISMALVLMVMMMTGIEPGFSMLHKHLDVIWSLIWTLVISNIIAVAIVLSTTKYLAKIIYLRLSFLVPVILLLVFIGAYGMNERIEDVILAFIMGALGYLMQRFGYSRVTLIVGFVLGGLLEKYFRLSLGTSGPAFLLKSPIAMVIILCIIPVISRMWLKRAFQVLRGRRGRSVT